MATVYVTLSRAGGRGASGEAMPICGKPHRTETITSSGTSASGALVAARGDYAVVFCDTAVVANAGATASQSAGKFCPAGIPTDVGMQPGDVIHVIDAV
jgi:hypothetical protein